MARCVLFPHYLIYKEQIKGLEFISSVPFAFGICCCQLSIWDPKSVSVKQAIIRLKNQNKPINCLEHSSKERTHWWAQQHQKTRKTTENCGGWQKKYFPGEEKPLHNSWPDQEHSPGGRCMCVKVNNQEKTSEYRGFTTRCKPLVSLKNRKTRLEWGAACSIVVKLMDLDPQGWWFDPWWGQDAQLLGLWARPLTPHCSRGYVSCVV